LYGGDVLGISLYRPMPQRFDTVKKSDRYQDFVELPPGTIAVSRESHRRTSRNPWIAIVVGILKDSEPFEHSEKTQPTNYPEIWL
jgi:hypothetical protein